jgi:hypothetical protein
MIRDAKMSGIPNRINFSVMNLRAPWRSNDPGKKYPDIKKKRPMKNDALNKKKSPNALTRSPGYE